MRFPADSVRKCDRVLPHGLSQAIIPFWPQFLLQRERLGLSQQHLVSLAPKDTVVDARDGGAAVPFCCSPGQGGSQARVSVTVPFRALAGLGMHPRLPAASWPHLPSVCTPCSGLTRTWDRTGVPANSGTHPAAWVCTHATSFNSVTL